ncbi:MAG: hypothetical protein JNK05_02230 [Myxococcales bacterium]|nr:hypothetical protein [Myxococcales bacterium]
MASASGDATTSRGVSKVVRVVVGDEPLRRTIDLASDAPLNLCVEGALTALRVTLDDEVVVDRPLTDPERSAGSVKLSLDRPAFRRLSRFSSVTVEVRGGTVDHPRGSVAVGEWRLAATLLVRGARARAVTRVGLLSLLAMMYWPFALARAGSPTRAAMDVACIALAFASWLSVRWPGGPRTPMLVVASVAAVGLVSAGSFRQTMAVVFVGGARSEVAGVEYGTEVRFAPGDVVAIGDGAVRIRGRSWVVEPRCSVDPRMWWPAIGGPRRLVVSSLGAHVTIERAAAEALGIADRLVVDCVEGPWLAMSTETSVRVAATAANERYAVPSVELRFGPRIRSADLRLGAPRPLAVHTIGPRPTIELGNERVPNVRLHYTMPLDAVGLWTGELGEGWHGAAQWSPRAPTTPFECDPGSNLLVTASVNRQLIEAIEGANFRFQFADGAAAVACVVDDGRSFGERSSITIALRDENAPRAAWATSAADLDADWRTIRWVKRTGQREELVAETTRVEPDGRGQNTVQHLELRGALADAREIALVRGGVRSVLWRRAAARPTRAVVNVVMGELSPQMGNDILVRVGDAGPGAERCATLAETPEGYDLVPAGAPSHELGRRPCGGSFAFSSVEPE